MCVLAAVPLEEWLSTYISGGKRVFHTSMRESGDCDGGHTVLPFNTFHLLYTHSTLAPRLGKYTVYTVYRGILKTRQYDFKYIFFFHKNVIEPHGMLVYKEHMVC